ncbi:hypothetical protein [Chondrinema litorale]|uniref:hypothetical protein n=1 Tax=Chondrinema litorale TaxID=2994555 RepID=UPI0025426FA2|nr:hypothetical protein [Chondrinema litorale]UZS00312.1 hypothetical protein OQ292_40975 [Chondrinema litorale]
MVDISREIKRRQIFWDWVSGIFIVRHGKSKEGEDLSGYFEFKASEITYLRLKKGILLEKYTVPTDFDLDDMPENVEEGLKKILDELK